MICPGCGLDPGIPVSALVGQRGYHCQHCLTELVLHHRLESDDGEAFDYFWFEVAGLWEQFKTWWRA